MFKNQSTYSGVSLIELMMALVISSLLLSCLITVFIAIKNINQVQIALNAMQDNSRAAAILFNSEIKMAGYIGCAKLTKDFPLINNFLEFTDENKINFYVDPEMKKNSDGILIAHASESHAILAKGMHGYSVLDAENNLKFSANDIVLISDCKNAEVARIKNISFTTEGLQQISLFRPLAMAYAKYSEITPLEVNRYYLSPSSSGLPMYSLYKKDIESQTQEMIEGIDEMKVFFEIIKDNQLIEIPANQRQKEMKIVAVSIKLTLSSIDKWIPKKDFYIYTVVRQA